MNKRLRILGLSIGWFAIVAQFILMLLNRQVGVFETIVRFFSFFTILTNILVALFFTVSVFKTNKSPFNIFLKKGTLTAITAFILIVGLVYQIALRDIWNPTGLQRVVDELLHTIIPLFMLGYWSRNIKRDELRLKPIFLWLLYPVFYLIFVFVRGHFSGFYPYPFLNVSEIGYENTLLNIAIIFGTAIVILTILIIIGKKVVKV